MKKDLSLREQVGEFHRAFGICEPSKPLSEVPDLLARSRIRLIAEEFVELLRAFYASDSPGARTIDYLEVDLNKLLEEQTDVCMIDAHDAMADLDFVIEGTRREFGTEGKPIADEVFRTNMAKLHDGNVVRDANGKIRKPKGWNPPNVCALLIAQGWEPPKR